MIAEVFLDSNVLLYACSSAPDDAEKRRVAEDFGVIGVGKPGAVFGEHRGNLRRQR